MQWLWKCKEHYKWIQDELYDNKSERCGVQFFFLLLNKIFLLQHFSIRGEHAQFSNLVLGYNFD